MLCLYTLFEKFNDTTIVTNLNTNKTLLNGNNIMNIMQNEVSLLFKPKRRRPHSE